MARRDPGRPNLLEKVSMAPEDKSRLVKLTAARMRTDSDRDIRPALLVHLAFAAADFAFQRWVRTSTEDRQPLQLLVSEALQAVMHPRWQPQRSRTTRPQKRARR
ncbi:hypothetical protein I553_4548 [Mycobacterium xenopi 4042]|uniref:Uncharacterized protein n=1 Tax=Mycobacterium xenopi 4042 TaxID=1299334 RepID=X8AGP4_MYCXE|nr:hypothetical protein I553_4548 [Mycobacterium xenopi 4042]EUA50996.1 hypothetical protein I552_1937 [Mycobacterium xenopi 3993]